MTSEATNAEALAAIGEDGPTTVVVLATPNGERMKTFALGVGIGVVSGLVVAWVTRPKPQPVRRRRPRPRPQGGA